ncbi:hypothetical protein FSP39_007069 [Pinctada imbricata]|uniref:C3H1-type domain-containing protein n=1 Tax=Pinctada imbricata TaxID=66713 RepID=A0AA88YL67_PINIB|nr:hypothetical protein FSP39_007069 [Pinctada imbricata]
MPPITRRKGRGRNNPVARNTATSTTAHAGNNQAPPQQIPVISQSSQPTVTAQQLKDVTDQVTTRVLAQLNANDQMPIYDANRQGNDICSDILDENVSIENFQVESATSELGYNVSNKIKMKIANGDYVDLATLVSKPSDSDSLSKQLKIEDGKLVLGPKSHVTKIDNIDQWTDAFLIYASIYSIANPPTANSLFKYMHTVRLGASRFGGSGWKNYDIHAWSSVDQELWLLFMNSKPQQEKESSTNLKGNSTQSNLLKCYNYNFKGFCSRAFCNYAHQCLRCSNPHSLKKCRVASFTNNNSRFQQSLSSMANPSQSGLSSRAQNSGKFRR